MAILEVKNLSKQFKDFLAVSAVSFSAHEGEIFGLLGPNGAGKTTTIRLIATILAPTGGTAEVAGFDIVKDPEAVRRKVGILTTDIGAYERFSGRENLQYFARLYGLSRPAAEKRIEELSKLLVMEDFIDRRVSKYSTGMKQKLAIARSVIHDPQVIIFDEPTSGLDVLASQTVLNFMKRARQEGRCVIFSTHQMDDAERLCDRVAIIHQSRLVACDTLAALKQQTGTSSLVDAFLKLAGSK
jgi:sodium transport system ATP-binding protein